MAITKYLEPTVETSPVDRLASEIFGSNIARILGSDGYSEHIPRVNIMERKGEYRLEMQAPGFDKKDLKVEMRDDTLTIRGEHEHQATNEDERFTRREFAHKSFERSFVLPNTANTEKIVADYKNGVLALSIPKLSEGKPSSRKIDIK
jgi:HSP20 family protein